MPCRPQYLQFRDYCVVRDCPLQTVLSGTQRARPAWSTATLLLGLGQCGVDAGLIFRQAGTPGRVGLRLAPGLRLALGVFSVAGHESLVLGVGVPRCLPDSPDEVLKSQRLHHVIFCAKRQGVVLV